MYSSVNTINWELRKADIIFSLGTGHCELLSPARRLDYISPRLQSTWKSIQLKKKKKGGGREVGTQAWSARDNVFFMNGISCLKFAQCAWASLISAERLWQPTLQCLQLESYLPAGRFGDAAKCGLLQQQGLAHVKWSGLQRASAPSVLKTGCPEPVGSCCLRASGCLSLRQPSGIFRSKICRVSYI